MPVSYEKHTLSVSHGAFLLYRKAISCNYEKHALRVSRVIAVLAKSACKHAIFLATRVKKRESIKDSLERGDNQIRTGDKGVADPCLTTWLCRHILL